MKGLQTKALDWTQPMKGCTDPQTTCYFFFTMKEVDEVFKAGGKQSFDALKGKHDAAFAAMIDWLKKQGPDPYVKREAITTQVQTLLDSALTICSLFHCQDKATKGKDILQCIEAAITQVKAAVNEKSPRDWETAMSYAAYVSIKVHNDGENPEEKFTGYMTYLHNLFNGIDECKTLSLLVFASLFFLMLRMAYSFLLNVRSFFPLREEEKASSIRKAQGQFLPKLMVENQASLQAFLAKILGTNDEKVNLFKVFVESLCSCYNCYPASLKERSLYVTDFVMSTIWAEILFNFTGRPDKVWSQVIKYWKEFCGNLRDPKYPLLDIQFDFAKKMLDLQTRSIQENKLLVGQFGFATFMIDVIFLFYNMTGENFERKLLIEMYFVLPAESRIGLIMDGCLTLGSLDDLWRNVNAEISIIKEIGLNGWNKTNLKALMETFFTITVFPFVRYSDRRLSQIEILEYFEKEFKNQQTSSGQTYMQIKDQFSAEVEPLLTQATDFKTAYEALEGIFAREAKNFSMADEEDHDQIFILGVQQAELVRSILIKFDPFDIVNQQKALMAPYLPTV